MDEVGPAVDPGLRPAAAPLVIVLGQEAARLRDLAGDDWVSDGSYCSTAHGGEKHSFVVVPTSSFEPKAVCSTAEVKQQEQNGVTVSVPLVHRHGPCAPSSLSFTNKPSLAETLRRSRARADYIIRRAFGDGNVSVPTYLGTFVDSLEYAVTVGIGTPAVSQVVLVDTGSDLSWVQCQPCNSTKCYKQKDPLFDPRNTSTYAPIPCNSDTCRQLTADHYGADCTDGGAHCGYFRQQTDRFDGLLGLGGTPESLPVQTASTYGGAFSYCLPPVKSKPGFLSLGAPSRNVTPGFAFTPMGRVGNRATWYVVRLTGISVGGKPLDVPASAFRGGMIVDSGQIVTRLQTTPYDALQAAFRKAMAAYPRLHNGDLDTCYNFTGYGNVTVPKIALTFAGGATVDLHVPHGVLLNNCLAFEESGPDIGLGMIGNVNTRTLEVLSDVGRSQLGFRRRAC
ncbi:hypothetical protein PR202_ga17077 [Eleusine coracana subsp. coracana]|uniref:Peptidase A1 domain-containing protein n=1 Tax=Eleusine coracana subsp. coracana TaxID=191504 RepID=A0AAV5CPX4_ELECO|nr:hypothetical protein QOZ80_6AG0518830 [Eleusine coracana subsp. coracana]GJM99934.1 hypothetical protein PR202_ga17077 [Eleusine coracana subsp. coracana]